MSSPPPVGKTLALRFAADCFDDRMHRNTAGREHTPLGMLVEGLWALWAKEDNDLIARSFEACIRREAPDVLAELRKRYNEQRQSV